MNYLCQNKIRLAFILLLLASSIRCQTFYGKTSDNTGFVIVDQKNKKGLSNVTYNFEDSRLGFSWTNQQLIKDDHNAAITPNNIFYHSLNTGFSFTEDENFFSVSKDGINQGVDFGYTMGWRLWSDGDDSKPVNNQTLHSWLFNVQGYNNAATFNSANYSQVTDTTGRIDTILALKKAKISNELGLRIGIGHSWDHSKKGNMTTISVSGLLGYSSNYHDEFDEYQHTDKQVSYKDKDGNSHSLAKQTKYFWGNPENTGYRGLRLDFAQRLFTFNDDAEEKSYESNYLSVLAGATSKWYGGNDAVLDAWIGPAFFRSYNKPVLGVMFKISDVLSTQKEQTFADIYSFNIFFGIPFGTFK